MKKNNKKDSETEKLRERLLFEAEGAAFSGIGPALVEMVEIEQADEKELKKIAKRMGF
ncbi:MAG: hypothetical protein GX219_02325 [Tissierellia bacterium]|nr:hypothetical protein [Tissierellia bacterium]